MDDPVTTPGLKGQFSVGQSANVVNARNGPMANARLDEVMSILVKHLHAAVKEARITTPEWMAGIQFLTEVGHMCNEWRQEFILLSDVLGVSMLVDALDHARPAIATENTVLGPFYLQNPPRYANGANICLDGKGEPTIVRGRVLDTQGNPIVGASVDAWQCNDEGFYDVQQKGVQPEFNLRGLFQTGPSGEFWFQTVKPRYYAIPHDGPVGRLLSSLDRHPNRAAHIHFIVGAEGYDTAVTHVFPPDCPYLGEDAVFGVKASLVTDFKRISDPDKQKLYGFGGPFWLVEQDFVLVRPDVVSAE